MIWQAFAECDCVEQETRAVTLFRTPAEAYRYRVDRVGWAPFHTPISAVLRRVSWEAAPGLLLDCRLGMPHQDTHRFRVCEGSGYVAWPETLFPLRREERSPRAWNTPEAFMLPVFAVGSPVNLEVFTMEGRGVGFFTFDFESVP